MSNRYLLIQEVIEEDIQHWRCSKCDYWFARGASMEADLAPQCPNDGRFLTVGRLLVGASKTYKAQRRVVL